MTARPALLDTSVIIDIDSIAPDELPAEWSISAVTMAELAAGPHAARDAEERARRQGNLQHLESQVEPIPFDSAAAQAYGQVFSATLAAGREPRGTRVVDLMIAATALANQRPLFTRNPKDFEHLRAIGLEVHGL
jgi:predicted nucleic acid-binding protein